MKWWRIGNKSTTPDDAVQAVLDHQIDAVLIVDSDGNTRFANRTAEKIFGRPVTELVGRPFGLPASTQNATEANIPRPDGSRIEVEIRAVSMNYEGKSCSLTTIRDITPDIRNRSALLEQETRFSGLFENAPLGMALVTLEGRWMRVNKALWEILGYQRDELLNTLDVLAITHPDDVEISRVKAKQIRDGKIDSYQLKKRYLAKDGSVIHAIVSVNLVKDEFDRPLYHVIHMVDISQAVETELQLQHMQKMESLGHLTGGIAHDFNNILAVIMGNVQLIQRKIRGMPEVEGLAAHAVGAVRRGSELTQRLLSFSHNHPSDPQRVNLNQVLGDITEMLDRTLGPEIEIRTQLEEDLWPTMADISQLENAILNLCINSRDAMPRGGQITLTTTNIHFDGNYVDSHRYAQEGDYVALYVTDTGTGIASELISKIFDPFFTTKPKGKGTGLGLSSVFGFVKQSGGYIDVHSEPGHTTMKIYLPRAAELAAASQDLDPSSGDEDLNGSGRILIVDDEADIRASTAALLNIYGYQTEEAPDGRQALVLLRSGSPFDLVLSDVLMPGGIDGLALLQRIAKDWPDTKVMLMSGFTDSAHWQTKLPGVELLAKPFTDLALLRKVKNSLAKPNPQRD